MVCLLSSFVPFVFILQLILDIFLQSDPTGRLPYGILPTVLQRFGIGLTEQDLTSAAQSLEYNSKHYVSLLYVSDCLLFSC